MPRERKEQSLGSGVIVSPDGYILTNNHVVDDATEVKVSLGDKREYTARVVGKDSKTDLAVLKIDQTGLPEVPRDVYAFVIHEGKVRAPAAAMELIKRVDPEFAAQPLP